ncbi:hypothetical protein ACFQZE_07350 [Paenibacillus sp. GCM10027627]|uniref:hypothetical protein n=1 Tax=unclassified Paenibacillus TaxID=185978 RepID=UPI003633F56B
MNKKINDATLVDVYNNTSGVVSFRTEGKGKRKWDKANSVKKVTVGELKELINSRGGEKLLLECLLIKDISIREELNLPTDPEHLLDGTDVQKLLKEEDADKLQTILENTNEGIKDKIASVAIEQKINDTDKMELIQEHTGIDVYSAIKEKKEEEKEAAKEKEDKSTAKKTR